MRHTQGHLSNTANALNQYTAIDSVTPAYDADGNATSYPLPVAVTANSTLIWDAENRLIEVKNASSATLATYSYDYLGRRISKTVGSVTTRYIYDGWNPVTEYTGITLSRSYTWGMDLSGSMQGAGGVGGLLAVHIGSSDYYPTYDGNGNVSEYLDSAGAVQAHYEYDAFGNTTVATGTKAGDFAHRFSTKPLDVETGLYYYGYRYYDPVTGRWPSRDPIEEMGGYNLYGFVRNSPLNWIDRLGMMGFLIIVDSSEANDEGDEKAFTKALITLAENKAVLEKQIKVLEKRDDKWWASAIKNKKLLINGKYHPMYSTSKTKYLEAAKREMNSKVSYYSGKKEASQGGIIGFLKLIQHAMGKLDRDYDVLGMTIHGWYDGDRYSGDLSINGNSVPESQFISYINASITPNGFKGKIVRATCGSGDGVTRQGAVINIATPFLKVGRSWECYADLSTFDIFKVNFPNGVNEKWEKIPDKDKYQEQNPNEEFDGWNF